MSRSDSTFAIVVAAVWVVAAGLTWGTYSAGAADPYGYVSESDLWVRGDLVVEQPVAARLPWPDVDATLAPLGYRPGSEPGTLVPVYSTGLPIVMAVFQLVAGPRAVFWVVPILGALAVVATGLLARQLSGTTAGAFAALVLASSPTLVFSVMWPMSDAAAAGWWALAVLAVTRRGLPSATVGGAVAAIAVMTRPNLVGVAVVPFAYLVVRLTRDGTRRGWWRLLAFSGLTAVGCLAVAWVHTFLYGSPLESGYGDLDWFFETSRGVPNAGGFLVRPLAVEPVLVMLAVVGVVAVVRSAAGSDLRLVGALCAGVIGVVLASYLFFYSFPEWWYLRLLLPAYPAVAVLAGAGVAWTAEHSPARWRNSLLGGLAAVVVFVGLAQSAGREVFRSWEYESRYEVVGRFVAEELPPDAVLFAFHHGGSLRYYADRLTVRFDVLAAEWLEPATAALRDLGFTPYFVVEGAEAALFRERFRSITPLGDLDWPPTAELQGSTAVWVYDPADRQRHLDGESIVTRGILARP